MTKLRGLYAITDNRLTPASTLLEAVEEALRGGVSILQYRDKHSNTREREQQALDLLRLCHEYDALLIINDDVKLAADCGADGVHLGQEDETLSQARDFLGNRAIIGASCYNRLELAEKACAQGADYLAFGRFFPSSTKPDAIQAELEILARARTLGLPLCAIGGISLDNAASVIEAGADMIAVVEGVFGQPDICKASTALSSLF